MIHVLYHNRLHLFFLFFLISFYLFIYFVFASAFFKRHFIINRKWLLFPQIRARTVWVQGEWIKQQGRQLYQKWLWSNIRRNNKSLRNGSPLNADLYFLGMSPVYKKPKQKFKNVVTLWKLSICLINSP